MLRFRVVLTVQCNLSKPQLELCEEALDREEALHSTARSVPWVSRMNGVGVQIAPNRSKTSRWDWMWALAAM